MIKLSLRRMLFGLMALAMSGWVHATPATPLPYVEGFDSLKDGTVNCQAGWTTSGAGASVVDLPEGGKALTLPGPYGGACIDIPAPVTAGGAYTISFRTRFTRGATAGNNFSQKLIVTGSDASGNPPIIFYHDGTGDWGIKSGGRYYQSPLLKETESWSTVQLVCDDSMHTVTLRVINAGRAYIVYNKVSYADSGGGPVSKLSFGRNGQGAPGACLVDDVSVFRTFEQPVDRLEARVTSLPRVNVVEAGMPVDLSIEYDRSAFRPADKLDWTIEDFFGVSVKRGTLAIPAGSGTWKGALTLGLLPSGYYAITGKLRASGVEFSSMGTRRLNLSSFCVLPSIQAIPLRQADDSRFGIQGTTFVESGKILVGDPYTLYPMLGVKWVNYNARWDLNEGMQAGQYKPVDNAPHGETAYAAERGLSLLTCSEGVPRWAMDVPANDAGQVNLDNQAYPPKDINAFERYLEAVATHQDKMRRDFFPAMSRNWYQLSWEPDWHFKGTPQQYVDMCAHASAAIHRGDPTARVMATGGGILAKTVEWLRIMLPMGLGKSIDGIATHAYYDNDGNPFRAPMPGLACAPEDGRVIANMRELKALAHRYLRPGARIMQTEWCMEYKGSYSTLSPELLRRHAAHIVRGHIILLGEGADTTFLFYTSEGEGEAGGGFTFNLIDGLSGCGAVDMSPKPEFPACAAMTRVLEGTKTIGPLTGLPADCYGYAFDRAGKTVVAVWKAHPGPAKVSLPLAGPKCEIIDFMGNSTSRGARNCNIKLDVCEYPVYVLGVESRRLSR